MLSSLLLAATLTTEVIGSYAGGCIQNSVPLPLQGDGYQVIRVERERYFGHPNLIKTLQAVAKQSHQAGLPLLYIGDLGRKNGGPFESGHSSHQNGLDADIWFRMGNRPIKPHEAQAPAEWPLIDEPTYQLLPGRFTQRELTLLRLAATQPQVERIFINPAIKAEVCRRAPNEPWLQKLRPWTGHFSHFHLRLGCPKGSPECKPQSPLPPGNGCDEELQSWLRDKPQLSKTPVVRKKPKNLPARCS